MLINSCTFLDVSDGEVKNVIIHVLNVYIIHEVVDVLLLLVIAVHL